jgi:site-specific recombinase XerD
MVATYFKCLKAFTRWMHKKGWTERDRFEDVKQPPFARPKFDTLTVEQKTTILTEMNPQSFLGARNIAILCFFMDTGVRLEELVYLEADRVHLADRYIEVFSRKTGDWRVIPLSDEAVAVCQHYMQWRARFAELPIRRRAAAGDANHRRLEDRAMIATTFFCSWSGAPLTENAIGLMVRRLRRRLTAKGFEVRIHPDFFRHNFLTEKPLDGERPSMVRRWAGHRSYEMTDYYFAEDATRLKSSSSNSHDLETRALSSGERSI